MFDFFYSQKKLMKLMLKRYRRYLFLLETADKLTQTLIQSLLYLGRMKSVSWILSLGVHFQKILRYLLYQYVLHTQRYKTTSKMCSLFINMTKQLERTRISSEISPTRTDLTA